MSERKRPRGCQDPEIELINVQEFKEYEPQATKSVEASITKSPFLSSSNGPFAQDTHGATSSVFGLSPVRGFRQGSRVGMGCSMHEISDEELPLLENMIGKVVPRKVMHYYATSPHTQNKEVQIVNETAATTQMKDSITFAEPGANAVWSGDFKVSMDDFMECVEIGS